MQVHEAQETADHFKLPVDEVKALLKHGRAKLLAYRLTSRPKPHRDDKVSLEILTDALSSPQFGLCIDFDVMERYVSSKALTLR